MHIKSGHHILVSTPVPCRVPLELSMFFLLLGQVDMRNNIKDFFVKFNMVYTI